MDRRSAQAPSAVIMIRPHHFSPNEETAKDNAFQKSGEGFDGKILAKRAFDEASIAATTLATEGQLLASGWVATTNF